MLELIPVGEISTKLLRDLSLRLGRVFSGLIGSCSIGAPLKVPRVAYNAGRGQYDADPILELVLRELKEKRGLAVLDVDLYTSSSDLNFIFGQAQCPGRAALISIHRLDQTFYGRPSDYGLLLERATKEAVHELGHTFGLDHCSNPACVMSFSNSILDVDRKSSAFCGVCRKKIFAR